LRNALEEAKAENIIIKEKSDNEIKEVVITISYFSQYKLNEAFYVIRRD
jgi:hypothetical protein